jgi:hypothetical protein
MKKTLTLDSRRIAGPSSTPRFSNAMARRGQTDSMGNRKALLIGIENYGEGFVSLPATRQDIERMHAALQVSGYQVEICSSEVLANASMLDATMRRFCAAGAKDDTHILYFTGHGFLADNGDWIVPAGTSRKDATISPNQRVSTDLSRTIADSSTGLVLFIIDACRDPADIPNTKGGVEWGDPARIERPSEHRFVRLFGCAANQVCQVLPQSGSEPTSSLFTRALADSLSEGDCASLKELLPQIQKHCNELLAKNVLLRPQTPHLSYGEISVETEAVLQRIVFDPVVRSVMAATWDEFNPDKLHCLVVLSEYDHDHQRAPDWWGLRELVNDAVAGETGERIWKSFRAACNGRTLLSGRQRKLPETFEPSAVSFGSFSVVDALGSGEALDKAVRMVVEADLVVFDVTGFEPAVMLLIGIRSACCRSLTVCSHGADWKEGHPIKVPFNLQDLNISSHTPRETRVGSDPVVERFVQRVEQVSTSYQNTPSIWTFPATIRCENSGLNTRLRLR